MYFNRESFANKDSIAAHPGLSLQCSLSGGFGKVLDKSKLWLPTTMRTHYKCEVPFDGKTGFRLHGK